MWMFWVGLVLIVVGAAGFLLLRGSHERVRALRTGKLVNAAEVTALSGICEVSGRAEAGPDGFLEATVSKASCVWHRHLVWEHYVENFQDSSANTRYRTRTRLVVEFTSKQPWTVRDESGSVLVFPEGAAVFDTVLVLEKYERYGTAYDTHGTILGVEVPIPRVGTVGYKYQEWVLRPRTPIFVHGEASERAEQVVVGKPEDGPYLIAGGGKDKLKAKLSLRYNIFTYGGSALMALGLALLIAGVVR